MFDRHWYDQIEAGHKYADAIIISHIVLLVLTTLALAVRFAAKLNTKARLGLDDACIIVAQVLFYVCAGVNMRSAYLAKYVVEDTDAGYKESTILAYASGCMYAPQVIMTNISILLFYRTVFPVQEVKRIVYLFIAVEAATGVAGAAAQIFACTPISGALYYPRGGPDMTKCINYPAFFISILTIELLGDMAILALPIWQISKLKLDSNTKWMLCVVFLLGGLSIISGIVRIQQSLIDDYWFIDLYKDMFWIAIHEATAIIAASLPICRPLVRILAASISSTMQKVYSFGSYVSKYSYRSYASGSSGSNGSKNQGSSLGGSYYKTNDSRSTPSEHSQRDLVARDHGMDTIDQELFIMEKRAVKPVEITVERTYEVV